MSYVISHTVQICINLFLIMFLFLFCMQYINTEDSYKSAQYAEEKSVCD